MKRITLYSISLLLLLISCNNEQMIDEYGPTTPIRFCSQCISISTKTTNLLDNNKLPENTKISLFSIQHLNHTPSSYWNPELFNNTQGITDKNGNISYNNTYYFPVGEQLDFFAIHPYISAATTGADYDGTQYTTVTLKENTNDQYDLMYASLLNQSKKSSLLVFEFHHLLSQITLNIIKAPGITVDLPLTKVEVVAPQSGTLDIWNGTLSGFQGETTYTLDTNTTLSSDETPIPGQFLLFPQKVNEMLLTFGNDASNVFHVTLSGEPQSWEPGVNYLYNITISRNITDSASPETPVTENTETPTDETPADNTPADIIPADDTPTDSTAVAPETKAITTGTVQVYGSID